jgi:RNA polymerase-binding transcription factor DksA
MMTEPETKDYRQRLLALAERLSRDVSDLEDEALRSAGGEASGGLSNVPIHLGDLGSHQFEGELDFCLVGNEEKMLAEVNAALARLDLGTFGRCESCGKNIAKERLLAVPYTRNCLDCAQKLAK